MPKLSAGLVLFRWSGSTLEVFLVHPGGPFWQKKDWGAWSIPKGEYEEGQDPLEVAYREFEEETGMRAETRNPIPLDDIKQPSGKIISAWAIEQDCSSKSIRSNSFSMEWPPRSGKIQEFPEIDRAEWFVIDEGRQRLTKGQVGFLDRLAGKLNYSLNPDYEHGNTKAASGGQGFLFG
jgi:predicted NUDIX family NTP pyrophosphohydrolase